MDMLTFEEQNIIENSLWIVNTALKKQGLQGNEDLKQSAVLYMCKCIKKYDPSKQVKWNTYAYKNVFLYIKRTNAKDNKRQSAFVNQDIYDMVEPVICHREQTNNFNESKFTLEKVKRVLDPKERQVIDLKLQGYKAFEISKIMGCSQSKINDYMQIIKSKARAMMCEEEEREL